jgi:hypothetical protein
MPPQLACPNSPGVSNIIQAAPRTSALADQLPPLSIRVQPGLAPGFWLCVLILISGSLLIEQN